MDRVRLSATDARIFTKSPQAGSKTLSGEAGGSAPLMFLQQFTAISHIQTQESRIA
jgi:hypothetical protein